MKLLMATWTCPREWAFRDPDYVSGLFGSIALVNHSLIYELNKCLLTPIIASHYPKY